MRDELARPVPADRWGRRIRAATAHEVARWGGAPSDVAALWGAALDEADSADGPVPYARAASRARAWLDGWSSASWWWGIEGARDPRRPRPAPYPAPAPPEVAGEAVGWVAPVVRRPRPEPRPLPEDHEERWTRYQLARRQDCGALAVHYRRAAASVVIRRSRCDSRTCLRCARLSLRRAVWRYGGFFAVPLLPGWCWEFCTLGSLAPVGTRADLARWRRGVGQVLRGMYEGRADLGLARRTWAAALCVCEVTPRDRGAYAHAHIVAVRRARYPYGWSRARLARVGVEPTRTGRYTAARVAAAGVPPGEALGARELQRRCGVGEVGRHDVLRSPRDTEVVARYLGKVAHYLAKADGSGSWYERRTDLAYLLRGSRRVQPSGDLLGALAAPDLGWYEVDGRRDPREWLGAPQREDAEQTPALEGERRVTVHQWSWEAVEAWRPWADVDAWRAWLASRHSR